MLIYFAEYRMNFIIKTGFKSIKYYIKFQAETILMAKKLSEANHVFNVGEQCQNGCVNIKAHK